MTEPRKKRANGEESRRRILQAATEVAGERGYEGTSIALVSAKCGLPASSIYWHFADKDDLIGAVIEQSFATWLAALELPDETTGSPRERLEAMAAGVAKSLMEAPDFLRLGLMLALERRPTEPRGRAVFLEVRQIAGERLSLMTAGLVPGLTEAQIRTLTTYAVAAADGLFIAHEIDGDAIDLAELFALHAGVVYEAARELARQNQDD